MAPNSRRPGFASAHTARIAQAWSIAGAGTAAAAAPGAAAVALASYEAGFILPDHSDRAF